MSVITAAARTILRSPSESSALSQEPAGNLGAEETPSTSVSKSVPTLSDSDPCLLALALQIQMRTWRVARLPRGPHTAAHHAQHLHSGPRVAVPAPKQALLTESLHRTLKSLAHPTPSTATPKPTPVIAAKTKGLAGGDRSQPVTRRP